MERKRIVIVGGVAGGATCAARARRLDEHAEIVMFERGPYVSFANCGLPYHVGDVIPAESDLLLMSPSAFRERLAIEVHVNHEVVAIDRERREVRVRDVIGGAITVEPYDALVLATGARAIRPPIAGLEREGVFELRTVPDSRRIREWIGAKEARRAVVVGAGFVGLELAENLVERGLEVDVVDFQPQVLGHLDPEMAALVADHLRAHGVKLHLGTGVTAVEADEAGLTALTTAGERLLADLIVVCTGVRPETGLARDAGLAIGPLGGIAVDDQMRTDDPHVWAVGDVCEDPCAMTHRPLLVPLAGPANRQARVAADVICGRPSRYRGVQGTAVIGLFGLTVASTGTCERKLPAELVADTRAIWLHPKDHVGWFPGATTIHLKLVFSTTDGRVMGAQAIGASGVERRIDVIAMAMQLGGTVYDLEEAELCYAPQFGAAKDPVNLAGMIAANHLRGDLLLASWHEIGATDALLVDVREPAEYAAGHVPDAVNLPLAGLRDHLDGLPHDRELWLYCETGKRSYDASRALVQRGYRVRNLPGGIETWRQLQLSP